MNKILERQIAHSMSLRAQGAARMSDAKRGSQKASTYTPDGAGQQFLAMARRAKIVNPGGRGEELAAYFEGLNETLHSADRLKERADMIESARGGDAEAIRMRAEAVVTSVSNIMLADMGWGNFFEMQSLGDEQWPMYEVSIPQEITVEAIGDSGEPQIVSPIQDKTQYPIPLQLIFTEWFEYTLRDLYKGNRVQSLAMANIDMGRDFAYAIENILASYILVGGANSRLTAAFDTTNADKKLRDYVAHSRVATGNFPAGNLITLSTNTANSNFRKDVLDAALSYCEGWGKDVDGSGALDVVSIRVCGKDIGAWREQVTLTSESNSLTEQIFNNGAILSYAGRRIVLEGDNTIDPADGMAYVQLNKPIGTQYEKTSFADVIIDENPALRMRNKGRMAQGSAFGWALPRPLRKNVLGIRYRDAA